jgi:hypothetical protein
VVISAKIALKPIPPQLAATFSFEEGVEQW